MNATTTLSLNDRFSMFKSSNGSSAPRARSRGRSSSRSRQPRGRPQQAARLGGSTRNRQLIDKMDKQHKMRLALKLKNKSILRSRAQPQAKIIRNNVRRAANILKAVNIRNLKRNNSLTTFVPLNDGPRRNMRGRSRSRSRSQSRARSQSRGRQQAVSITDRLGVRQPRGRMRRASIGGAKQQQQQQTSRSRPRSRVRLNRNNFANNRNAAQAQPQRRSNSVNARLGNSGPAQNRRRGQNRARSQSRTQLNRPIAGRIVKRKAAGARGQRGNQAVRKNVNQTVRKNGAALAVNARRGRVVKRGGGGNLRGQARGRARNRGNQNQSAAQGRPNQATPARRGRSRTRRGANNNRGGNGGKGGPVSKEQLDKQLDDYMSKASA